MVIRLPECTGWSASLLFASWKTGFLTWKPIYMNGTHCTDIQQRPNNPVLLHCLIEHSLFIKDSLLFNP